MQEKSLNKKPIRIPRAEHTLSRTHISQATLTVLYQLYRAGYQAYLVGGAIRDVLLGQTPKDFDIVTNARPDEIKGLFRNCRLIGRRFLLAHVRVNKEIVEVATFRAQHKEGGDGLMEQGRIVRDNVYGTIEEDVWRRDLTINALYYDIQDFSLLDYINGVEDLRAGIIRLIGNPEQRYQEDPVRMLRATRFAAKLGFTIEPRTAAPIQALAPLLAEIPPARLFDEVQKLFLTGHALQSLKQLRHYDLFNLLFPYTDECFDDPQALALIEQVLRNTDERLAEGKPVAPAFLWASLLWVPLSRLLPAQPLKGINQQEILLETGQYLLTQQQKHVSIPRRVVVLIQEIWLLQLRLTRQNRSKRVYNIMEHPRFRAGYDFLLLRANAGEEQLKPIAQWWTEFINSNTEERKTLLSPNSQSSKPSRRRRQKNKNNKNNDSTD